MRRAQVVVRIAERRVRKGEGGEVDFLLSSLCSFLFYRNYVNAQFSISITVYDFKRGRCSTVVCLVSGLDESGVIERGWGRKGEQDSTVVQEER